MALDAGQPGQAALDVFDQEPITTPDDPIATHPRVICTPHVGFVTEDELNLQFNDIFAQVAAFAVVVYALQVVLCHVWLQRFRRGPLEWLWRCLTYSRWEPMRR